MTKAEYMKSIHFWMLLTDEELEEEADDEFKEQCQTIREACSEWIEVFTEDDDE